MEKIKYKFVDILIFSLLCVVSNYLTIKLSYFSGDIINKIYDKTLMNSLGLYVLGLILFIILAMAFATIKNSYRQYLVGNKIEDYRTILYRKIMEKKLNVFTKNSPSYYHNLLYSDGESLRWDYFNSQLVILDSVILLLGATFYITKIHYIFFVIALLSTFIPYFVPKLYEGAMDRQRVTNSKACEDYMAFVKEGVLGIETIRDYHIEEDILGEFSKYNRNVLKTGNKLSDIQNLIVASSIFSGFLMYAVVLSSGVFLYSKGLITIGAILVASQLTNNVKSPTIAIINNKIYMNSTKSLRKKFHGELVSEKQEETSMGLSFNKSLIIENLNFSYNGIDNVLKDINLVIEKNKKYLIIGESGSGKSTFLKILMKWIDDYSGSIFIDDKNIDSFSMKQWNTEFVPVLQETYIFEKSLSFNIALGDDYDAYRLDKAIKLSGLSNFVLNLSNGKDTIINESASNISGGERKRLGIARALYREGNVLLVDEPFSSLDKRTQDQIEEMLLSLTDKTILNISHNYDEKLMKKYDYIIRFNEGKVNVYNAKDYLLNGDGNNE